MIREDDWVAATDFAAQGKANDFLLAQILAQAEADGEAYSGAELDLLRWPRSELTIEEEEALAEKQETPLSAEFSFLGLQRKAARHLRKAYAAARLVDPNAGTQFESAYLALRGAAVPLAGFTHRDAPILAAVMALRLEGVYDLVSTMVGTALTPYSLSPPYPTRVMKVVVLTLLAAGIASGLFLWLK